jgi:hypothetical protein
MPIEGRGILSLYPVLPEATRGNKVQFFQSILPRRVTPTHAATGTILGTISDLPLNTIHPTRRSPKRTTKPDRDACRNTPPTVSVAQRKPSHAGGASRRFAWYWRPPPAPQSQ